MGCRAGPRALWFTLVWGLGLAAGGAGAEGECLKLVFGRYCLGGDVGPLVQGPLQPLARETEGKGLALVFAEEADQVYVLSYAGRIYKVLRSHRVATQLRFEEILALLRQKYGPGEDRSRFPEGASTPGRRLAAIRRGEGRVLQVWRPSDAWHIELSWTRETGLALASVADVIAAERAAELGQGL
jgi:hypothetical protein